MTIRISRTPQLHRRFYAPLIFAVALMGSVEAQASETVTYTYDAKGRLVTVAHAGGPATGVHTTYAYDAADNRTTVSTIGATTLTPLIVVPLNGLTIITSR